MIRFRSTLLASALLLAQLTLATPKTPLVYHINLNDRANDEFKVTLHVEGLRSQNALYQFASTAPGTYEIMDIGRYVRSFKAFDKNGRELKTQAVSTNQWRLDQPQKVRTIQYRIAETWDTPVQEHHPYNMCGTSIEEDHVLINGQAVFGYPTGMQAAPIKVSISRPADWEVGTALEKTATGRFIAPTYDRLVDSPILLGRLTKASTIVAGAQIEMYTYSKTDQITSQQLLDNMKAMLTAAGQFLKQLPVKRYTFLYHFDERGWGAWEHSYSSEYVLKEEPYSQQLADQVTAIAAHEFFHVVTPLHIHSEIIQSFNFVTPTPSQHLWLYEGVTEWASNAMQLRGGLMGLPTYLDAMSQKIEQDNRYDSTYSLVKLGLSCYTDSGQQQYGNVYARGALTAGLLDIRLLELSGGKRGLREVINELATTYGPNRPFPEADFFTLFTQKTYPEIGDFFNRYVKAAEPLPYLEYYGKLGITYTPATPTGQKTVTLGMRPTYRSGDSKIVLTNISEPLRQAGVQENDEWVSFNGQPVTLENTAARQAATGLLKAGETYTVTVRRAGQAITLRLPMQEREIVKRYMFSLHPQATPQQLQLREAWMKNL